MGGQALAFLALPIIARLYSPEQLGYFQVMVAFCNTIGAISALSFERALLLDLGPARNSALAGLCLILVAGITVIALPLYGLFASVSVAAPVIVAGIPALVFVGAMVFFRGLFLINYTFAVSNQQVSSASWAIFLKDMARVTVRIGLGLTALNPMGLFVAGVVDWAVGSIVLWRQRPKFRWAPRKWRALIWRFRQFPLFYAPAAALTSLNTQMPVLLLGSLYTAREAGLYALAFLILDRPGRILAKAAGDVLMHSMAREDASGRRMAVVRNAIVLAILNLGTLLLIAGCAYQIAESFLGARWAETGFLALACIPHALALFLSDLSIGLYAAVSRTASSLVREISSALVLFFIFLSAYLLEQPMESAIFFSGLGHLLVQLGFLKRFYRHFERRVTG